MGILTFGFQFLTSFSVLGDYGFFFTGKYLFSIDATTT